MRIVIAAVGKLKTGPDVDLYLRYAKRCAAGRAVGISDFSLMEIPEARGDQSSDRMRKEADGLISKLKPASSDHLIVLDERGDEFASPAFASLIQRQLDAGTSRLIFAIGGPDGHGPAIRTAAQRTLSLSKMTLPHGLARIVLSEQIYRAITILSGHPYHRS